MSGKFAAGMMALAVVIILLGGTLWGLELAYADAGDANGSVSQTATIDTENDTQLQPEYADNWFDNETVEATGGGENYVEGTDYEFDAKNGTVNWIDENDNGESVVINATYEAKVESARKLRGLTSVGLIAAYLLPLAVGGVAMLTLGAGLVILFSGGGSGGTYGKW